MIIYSSRIHSLLALFALCKLSNKKSSSRVAQLLVKYIEIYVLHLQQGIKAIK